MKVLVTGGAGFIGANLARRLLNKNLEVHVLQKPGSNLWRLADIKNKLKFHYACLTDLSGVSTLLAKIKPRIIYHLAAYGAYPSQTDPVKITNTIIIGTFNLLLAAKRLKNLSCFVNTGSSAEYGKKLKIMQEKDYCEPETIYAAGKLAATNLASVFAKRCNLPIVTLRLFSVYGPYEASFRFISKLILAVKNKKSFAITDESVRHDFIYIDDVVDAYLAAVENLKVVKGKVLNIGSGREHTAKQAARLLFKVSGKKIKLQKGNFTPRVWDSPHWVADNSRARRLINWKPKTSLEKGLSLTWDWFNKYYVKDKKT